MIDVPHTDADVVIAAGDIHVQDNGVEWLKSFDKPVIYICGNHEYWRGGRQQTIDTLRKNCADSNIHFLERDSIELQGVVFHGCTLWTDYADGNQLIMEEAEGRINDFKYIQENGQALRPQHILKDQQLSKAWLQAQLAKHIEQPQVVISHHSPSKQSWGRSHADMLQFAYCNNFDDWLQDCPAKLWVHGHIHTPSDYKLGETRVICNPRGYHGLAEREDFNSSYCIEL
jgi:Icc-related predicted phosphoesterase